MQSDEVTFRDDPPESTAQDDEAGGLSPWRILVVDDDEDVFRLTRVTLRRLSFRGRPVEVLYAASAAKALERLEGERDIALALVDVVMETETAGLDLIKAIRSDKGMRAIRLVIRTGQPGMAPEKDIILDYEIDGYVAKSEMTSARLVSIVVASLRTHEAIEALDRLTAELEARVAARTADLEKLAMLDGLTGIANRRHFEMRAEVEIADARRRRSPLAVAMLDIDHFKRINDAHGHAVGDHILQQAAAVVSQQVRPSDLLARFGGEEFVLLLPDTDLPAALIAAERVRASLAAAPLFHSGRVPLFVTASLGVAVLRAGESAIAEPLGRADQALYSAKAAGRNRVRSRSRGR